MIHHDGAETLTKVHRAWEFYMLTASILIGRAHTEAVVSLLWHAIPRNFNRAGNICGKTRQPVGLSRGLPLKDVAARWTAVGIRRWAPREKGSIAV